MRMLKDAENLIYCNHNQLGALPPSVRSLVCAVYFCCEANQVRVAWVLFFLAIHSQSLIIRSHSKSRVAVRGVRNLTNYYSSWTIYIYKKETVNESFILLCSGNNLMFSLQADHFLVKSRGRFEKSIFRSALVIEFENIRIVHSALFWWGYRSCITRMTCVQHTLSGAAWSLALLSPASRWSWRPAN